MLSSEVGAGDIYLRTGDQVRRSRKQGRKRWIAEAQHDGNMPDAYDGLWDGRYVCMYVSYVCSWVVQRVVEVAAPRVLECSAPYSRRGGRASGGRVHSGPT